MQTSTSIYIVLAILASLLLSTRCDFTISEIVNDESFNSSLEVVYGSDTLYDVNLLFASSTRENANSANATWFSSNQFNINNGFVSSFQFQITKVGQSRATDGFAFVIQNTSDSIVGGFGGNLGYDVFPDSIAIEFDLYSNVINSDPNNNHIAIQYGGSANHSTNNLAMNSLPGFDISLKPHNCTIIYEPAANYTLSVFVNNILIVTANVNLADYMQNGLAWIGFTGATGLTSTSVYITDWSLVSYPGSFVDDDTFQLTHNDNFEQSTAAWFSQPQSISNGFSTNFTVRVETDQSRVFQGFAFILQNQGLQAVGSPGPYIGADIFVSNYASIVFMDSDDSDIFYLLPTNSSTGYTQTSGFSANLADNQPHDVQISYSYPLMTVCIDGQSSVMRFDLFEALNEDFAIVGFTSSTGDQSNNSASIYISNWSFAEKSGCPCSGGSCYVVYEPTDAPTQPATTTAPTDPITTEAPTTIATTQPVTTQTPSTDTPTSAPTVAIGTPCLPGQVCLGSSFGASSIITINQYTNISGNIFVNGGTLILQDSKLVNSQGSLELSPQSTLVLNLSNGFLSNLTINSSLIAIDGSVTVNEPRLLSYDNVSFIHIDGNVRVCGNLNVTIIVPPTHKSNFTIEIISSTGNLTGQFNNASLKIAGDDCVIYNGEQVYSQNGLSVLVTQTHDSKCDAPTSRKIAMWQIIVISVGAVCATVLIVVGVFFARKAHLKREFERKRSLSKIRQNSSPQLVYRGSRSLSDGNVQLNAQY